MSQKQLKHIVAGLEDEVARLKTEIRIQRQSKVWEVILSLGRPIIMWGGIFALATQVVRVIGSLAGTETSADIAVQLLANIDISVYLAWGVSFIAILYGLNQKRLKEDCVQKYHPDRVKEETKKDKNRSSSGLTDRGQTHPKDII